MHAIICHPVAQPVGTGGDLCRAGIHLHGRVADAWPHDRNGTFVSGPKAP
ncbi:hypothetical protein [Streptomyces misionensis]|nr:hypothetical protein [Streptomyces misionensis]